MAASIVATPQQCKGQPVAAGEKFASPGVVKARGSQVRDFARRLQEALDSADMSQSDLARSTGISKGTISRWCSAERGSAFDPLQLYRLSTALGCDYTWLSTGYGVAPPRRSRPATVDRGEK